MRRALSRAIASSVDREERRSDRSPGGEVGMRAGAFEKRITVASLDPDRVGRDAA
jgi:hypothetical protein